jgi:hypothetical protein
LNELADTRNRLDGLLEDSKKQINFMNDENKRLDSMINSL